MTIVWLIIWFVANQIGAPEPLRLDPMNAWAATLILAIGLDLSTSRARMAKKR